MGFELNRIMKQYGVSTPGMASYTGPATPSVPTAPTGSRPADDMGDADLAERQRSYDQQLSDYNDYTADPTAYKASRGYVGYNSKNFFVPTRPLGDRPAGTGTGVSAQAAYDKQLADFNAYTADPNALTEQMRKYNIDKEAYDKYKTTYQNRLQNTPMYAQGQFQTVPFISAAQAGQPDLSSNILTPEIAINLMHRSMTTGAPTSEFNRYGGYDKVKALYDAGGGSYEKPTLPTQQTIPKTILQPLQQSTQPGAKTVADLYRMYLGREPEAGIPGSAAASTRPNFLDEAQAELLYRNFGNQNLMNATGSYYGNQLKNPIYGVYPSAAPIVVNKNSTGNADADALLTTEQLNTDYFTNQLEDHQGVQRRAHGGSVHDLAEKYAQGGPVKTHYQTAGAVKLPSGYSSVEEEQDFLRRTPPSLAVVNPTNVVPDKQQIDMMPPVAVQSIPEPRPVLAEIAAPAPVAVVPTPVPVAPKAAMPFGDERLSGIQALLATYGPKDSAYAADLKIARDRATADSNAFTKMLTDTMKSPEDAQSSKAEIYFRLAAAFGAPTKTGQFSENLGMAGKELGEYAKGKRTSAKEKQLLGLEIQKLKMASSNEDLKTLRALAGEEIKDKRAIATELIKEFINSGKPQSAAGKQALDEGLVAGTPAYQARVAEIGNANVEAKMAQINSALSGVSTAAANLAVTQSRLEMDRQKFENLKDQQAKLGPGEVRLKVEAEDTLAQTEQAMTNLKKAYSLNPNTFDGSLLDVAQRKLYESAGSKDPKVVATRELENLLKKASLSQLKATFPGAISNDERAALDAVQGLDAKSKDERAVIMRNAYTALKSVSERHRRRLLEINQGVYRDTIAPIEGGTN